MTGKVVFLSDGKLFAAGDCPQEELKSQYFEKYRRDMAEIRKKNAWKTTGTGAKFTGMAIQQTEDDIEKMKPQIGGAILISGEKLVYALNTDGNTGLYIKNPAAPEEAEGFILRERGLYIYEMDYRGEDGGIIASASEDRITRSLCLFNENNPRYQMLTEGDAIDANPCFSKTTPSIVYYDSAGIYFDANGIPKETACRAVLSLNMDSGEIEEIAAEDGCDCLKPKSAGDGSLYYIKRPKAKLEKKSTTLKDIALAPGRIINAFIGWLNFFTQRYTGESLKSGGPNPAKSKQKSEEEIFIEGNLINAAKNLKENAALGEKHPGVAPKSWVLMKRAVSGEVTPVKKGVLDYTLTPEGVLYSNGRHILLMSDRGEELIATANLALGLHTLADQSAKSSS